MAKKNKSKNYAKTACIATIVLFGAITGKFIFGDIKQTVKNTDFSDSPVGGIIANVKSVGENVPANWNESGSQAEDIIGKKYKATFVRAKDGDTYVLSIDDVENTVRLIGVDTPESVAPASYDKGNSEEGAEVSEIVKNKLRKGDTVFIEFDTDATDRYDRFLCYVYFEDGTMVQDWLLENGYARTMTVAPNVKYAEHFKEIQHKAFENKVGFWNGFFEYEE